MLLNYVGNVSLHKLLNCKCIIETNEGKKFYGEINKFDDNRIYGYLLPKSTNPYLIDTFQINVNDVTSISGAKEIIFND